MDQTKVKEEVWQTIRALNRAWTVEGKADALTHYFHKDMVAIGATHRERLEGRDACVAAWKAFVDATKIHTWRETDPKVQLYGHGQFAVVTYYWDISYAMGEQTITLGGRDMFVLVNEDGKWWVIADQFSAYPQPTPCQEAKQ